MTMSNTITRIQEPVTGREPMADPAQPLFALSQFYRALNGRDLTLMERNWESSPEAAMDNPLGGIRRGWAEIRRTYEALFDAPWSYSFEFWDYTLHRGADVFWVVGRERGRLSNETETLDLAIRTTRLFRLSGGSWRQAHHHGSIEEPRLLARYLTAVRGVGNELA
jgi:ketosteroid isomerase-like protein